MSVPLESATPILVADSDPVAASLAARTLKQAGFQPIVAEDAATAVAIGKLKSGPAIFVVSWDLWAAATASVPEIRQARGAIYVIAMTARTRQADVVRTLEGGADEHLSKPFSSEELVARANWARRMLAAIPSPSADLRSAMLTARRSPGGEVVIGQGDTVGRIVFHGGKIVWANLSDRPATFKEILAGTAVLETDDLAELEREARRSGRHEVEVLTEWGLVPRPELEAALVRHLRQTIRAMLVLERQQAVFAPFAGGDHWTGPRFDIGEVVPRETSRELPAVRLNVAAPDRVVRCRFANSCGSCSRFAPTLSRELTKTGADGIALVHGRTGELLASAGSTVDSDMVRSQVRIMNILSEEGQADEVVASSAERTYVLCTTPCPEAYLVATADRSRVKLGGLKHELTRLVAQLVPDHADDAIPESLLPPPSAERAG